MNKHWKQYAGELLSAFPVAILIMLLIGCAAQTAIEGINAANDIGTKLVSVGNAIDYAIPHSDPAGQTRLKGARVTVAAAEDDVPVLIRNAKRQEDRAIKAEGQLKASQAALVAERDHYVGYKARVAAWFIIAATFGIAAIIAALYIFTPLAEPIGVAFHVVTVGIVAGLRKLRGAVELSVARASNP